VLLSLAATVAAMDRLTEAIALARRAVAADPLSVRAWTELGTMCLVHDDYGSATEALDRALRISPGDAPARYHMALLHVVAGDGEQARELLQGVVAAGPDALFAPEAGRLLEQLRAGVPAGGQAPNHGTR